MAGSDPSQYINSQMALQGAFYSAQQQQPVYSYEEMQLLQQSLIYAQQQQGQNLVATSREAGVPPTALGLYSIPDAAKYKTNPTYSSIPLAQQQQIAASSAAAAAAVANGTYMTVAGSGGMMAYNPYSLNMAVPGPYPQYAAPALVQIPSASHNLATLSQYPVQPKFVYGGVSGYNENMSPEYKAAYTSAPHVRKIVGASVGPDAASDLSGYKNPHGKPYQKPGFHSGTPPPAFRPELGTPGTSLTPPAAYAPMLISPMSPTSQYPSSLVHHQLNQDAESAGRGRAPSGIPSKGPNKGGFSRPNWGPN